MNGLTQSYPGKIEVRKINVSSEDGSRFFQYYGLPGHPGFILLNPQGEVLWKGFGEQASLEIGTQVRQALEQP